MKSKICRVCQIDKSISEYNKNTRNKDNLNNMCKECGKIYAFNYRKKNYEKVLQKEKEYDLKNHDKRKNYRKINKDTINNYAKNYRKINKEKVNTAIKKSKNKRYKNDIIFKIKENIRKSINSSIKRNGYSKKSRTHEVLGCSYEEFKLYLESKFEPWMNWDNYGLYNG
jgi:hypothetical protein